MARYDRPLHRRKHEVDIADATRDIRRLPRLIEEARNEANNVVQRIEQLRQSSLMAAEVTKQRPRSLRMWPRSTTVSRTTARRTLVSLASNNQSHHQSPRRPTAPRPGVAGLGPCRRPPRPTPSRIRHRRRVRPSTGPPRRQCLQPESCQCDRDGRSIYSAGSASRY